MTPTPERATLPILLAEDDGAMRELIASALRDEGFDVVEARDGMELLDEIEASIRRVRRDRFALVITDVRMPDFSGLDVLAALHCARWRTPVIVITAFGSAETHDEARELGALRVLDKPFDLDVLRAAVHEVLAVS